MITKTVILADGSYGTETIYVDDPNQMAQTKEEDNLPLRRAIKTAEDDFLASCIAISLAKLVVKCKKNLNIKKFNQLSIEASLIVCALLKSGRRSEDKSNA